MMSRKVWLATLALAGVVLAAGAASAQYRGYGYDDRGAADYYYGGPFGGGYYDDPGNGAYGAPSGLPPRHYRDEGYNPRDPGEGGPPPPPPGADAGYGYDQGPAPYVEPRDGGRDDGTEPGRKASDLDLQEGSQETTRTEVDNTTGQKPGTIVINTAERHLYYVEPNGQALRYGIGVGRQGFAWKGTAQVKRKQEWPDWVPPSDMLKRRPDLPTRMAGGIDNPLGARAMYLFQGNKDTMFRIHGTNEPDSIGKAMSSGCIRMMNKDVIDLYSRVPVGTKVVVL